MKKLSNVCVRCLGTGQVSDEVGVKDPTEGSTVNDPKTPSDEDPRADEPMPGRAAVDSLLDREIDLMAADEGDDIPF